MKILLLGGNGFLGLGLLLLLKAKKYDFLSLDKDDINLFDSINISKLVSILKDFDNIVILASKIGAKLFETFPEDSAQYNKTIHNNIFIALKIAAQKFNKSFLITYYSTSEVFNSQKSSEDFITNNTEYSFNYFNPRYLYSYNKWKAELDYFSLLAEHPEIISAVKILRPFNVFGRNQKRGVVYEMIKTALIENKIYFSDNTTRTLTDIDFASKMSLNAILVNKNMKINIVDNRNSLSMEVLAYIISDILNIKCNFIKLPPDKSIQFRNTTKINTDLLLTKSLMFKHIIELATQIKATF